MSVDSCSYLNGHLMIFSIWPMFAGILTRNILSYKPIYETIFVKTNRTSPTRFCKYFVPLMWNLLIILSYFLTACIS